MAEYAGQAVLHALIAAVVVEVLIRLWRIRTPDLRLAFCLLVLAVPLLILPAFFFLAPARQEEWFRERWAIFVGRRWEGLHVWGVGVAGLGLVLSSGLGVCLFLVDFLPLVSERLTRSALRPCPASDVGEAVSQELERLAQAMRLTVPPVRVVDTPAPLLFCAGVARPTLILSRSAFEILDRKERSAALAHELAHLARWDPLLGWLLILGRAAMCFNPAVQVVARMAVRDMEWRADDLAVATTGDPLALAGGLVKLFRAGGERQAGVRPRPRRALCWEASLARFREAAIEKRCRRLLGPNPSGAVPFGAVRIVLTGFALSCLLFFVV